MTQKLEKYNKAIFSDFIDTKNMNTKHSFLNN